MTEYIQTVRSRALPGLEVEYREWYLTTHLPAVLGIDGFVSGELLRSVAVAGADEPVEFLCVYRLETDDLATTQATMLAAGALMSPSQAMDRSATQVAVFERVAA